MTKLPPRTPCYAIFRGTRFIHDALYEHLHQPLEIVEYTNVRSKELAVRMIGKRERFPLATFSGEWTVLELERIAA